MKRRLAATAGMLLFGVVFFGLLISLQFLSGSAVAWIDYTSAERLVEDSDRIIIAEYIDETLHVIPSRPAPDGESYSSVSELYRRFEVIESLKGDAVEGDSLFVIFTKGYAQVLENGKVKSRAYQMVPVLPGAQYMLFLRGGPRRDGYPEQYGDISWGRTGEPGIALVKDDGGLGFKSSSRYKRGYGLSRVEGAPFRLSVDEVRLLVSQGVGAAP